MPGMMYDYFHEYCASSGIQLRSIARARPQASRAIDTSGSRWRSSRSRRRRFRNAVSKLHRHVSQEMWEDLWPDLPVNEVPITSVTNGVHLPTWLNGDFATLYDQYLQPDWRERYPDPKSWDLIQDIPDQELWEAHRRRKRRLIAFVRERMVKFAVGSQGRRRRDPAPWRSARSGRVHHRLRAPFRHLQARHACCSATSSA